MSITGSLVGYENNNEVGNNKKSTSASSRSILNTSAGSMAKTCPSLNSSINNSVITTTSSNLSHHNAKYPNSKRKSAKYLQHQQQAPPYGKDHKNYLHLNSLWSIWYGVLLTLFQGYLAVHGAYRFLGCSLIQWKIEPVAELNLQIVLCGVVFILLPLFFTSAVFKVGNLANDGVKLAGLTEKRCSLSPHDGLVEEARGGTLRALWTHGGPTAAFIHILIAMCLLLPRLLLEARIIENGLLPRENIWQTELDFIAINRRNLVVLSVISSPYQNISEDEVYNDTVFLANNNKLSESNEEQYRISYPKSAFFEVPDLLDANNSNENSASEEDLNKMRSTMPMSSATTTTALTNKQSTIRTTPTTTMTTTTTTTTTSTTLIIPTTAKGASTITKSSSSIVSGSSGGHTSSRVSHRRNGNRQHRNRSHRKHSSKSEESRTSRSEETDRELELRHSKAIDFNRLEDLEMVTVFENPSSGLGKSSLVPTSSQQRPNSVEEELEYGGGGIMRQPTTTTTRQTTTTLRDSNIHIVKPEKLPEIIPATPLASNSKIFEIKTKSKKVKRMADDELQVEIEPEYLIGEPPLNESTDIVGIGVGVGIVDGGGIDGNGNTPPGLVRLDGFSGMLQTFFGIEKEIDVTVFSHPPSAEFMNLVVALLVWSVRYPAVFWSTTKPFATIFSVQMVASSLEIIFSFIGISNLYKLQIFSEAIPVHNPGLILNAVVTLSLFILATILVLSSSMIMYLYGHGRLAAKMRDRSLITMKTSETWIYFAHCASLCFVLALAVVKAPLLNDLSATYRNNLHCPTFISALMSVVHILLWIVIWLGLTAKRRWSFKLPPIEHYGITKGATQPLLISTRNSNVSAGGMEQKSAISTTSSTDGVEDIYWPKLTPSSPKLKVTFNEVTSTCDDGDEQDGKRHSPRGATICIAGVAGEIDDGDYATLRGASTVAGGSIKILHLSEYDELPPPPPLLMPPPPPPHGEYLDDNTSEEGKLLACVRDDSVTYASTRDLEPPHHPHSNSHLPPPPLSNATSPIGIAPQAQPENMQLASSPEHLISPLAPVTVTLHTNEAHIASSSTPRCLRRADSGVPNEALTPRSDTTSTTESTTSPPERAPSESSSGVHSGEEREEVVIRPRAICKPPPKPPQPPIAEEPYGRSTNMRMSSFNNDTNGNGSNNSLNSNSKSNSATLPLQRTMPEQKIDYSHCSTMPLPLGCHSQASLQYKPQGYSPQSVTSSIGVVAAKQHVSHTTLPNGVRYSNPHFLRRIPHITKAESPYGHLGLGAGHHTFSKLLQDPMQIHSLVNTSIPEDRDSANYSMSSDQDCLYATTTHHHHPHQHQHHQHQHQHQHAN
ncbi:protein tincar [Episyrphus balteatus]|uniref:protein tincar n=1 Tax=Episyrphus balteatus TaxID=286459 RepID=UPI0024869F35|nr:protein tincar [Episyrphus balteatus]XP_055853104.1 protein tincar [Episyrphus balteatus]XP_055853105.1 protein tincar [Episyrphus balteatus]